MSSAGTADPAGADRRTQVGPACGQVVGDSLEPRLGCPRAGPGSVYLAVRRAPTTASAETRNRPEWPATFSCDRRAATPGQVPDLLAAEAEVRASIPAAERRPGGRRAWRSGRHAIRLLQARRRRASAGGAKSAGDRRVPGAQLRAVISGLPAGAPRTSSRRSSCRPSWLGKKRLAPARVRRERRVDGRDRGVQIGPGGSPFDV